MKFETMRNAEGYPDPTAYIAIRKHSKASDWPDGTVVKITNYNESENYRIVLKAYDNYATTIAAYKVGKG